MIRVNQKVRSRTPAGVEMARIPVSGAKNQRRAVTGILRNGIALEVRTITIDYDRWGDEYHGLGKVQFRDVLVRSEAGALGWVGAGALVSDLKLVRRAGAASTSVASTPASRGLRRTPKMKMWIGNLDGFHEGLVIATSTDRARKIVGTSRVDFEGYWILQPGVDRALESEVLYARPAMARVTSPWVKIR